MAITKESLKDSFSKNYQKYYSVELFKREGFVRKVCAECGKGFWTLDAQRTSCGDSSHTPYSFIKDKASKVGYVEFWKKFEDFFKKRNHTIVPRYPVISRWRDDLYFTIASIVDFQRLENGKTVFEYPANPLVVPQICLRFNDVANVGVTGRHLSGFMMAGQHAFDCDKSAYWKDQCIEYNFEFLTQVLLIPKDEITYGEDVWSIPDFSSLGPCIESFSKGSELVNSVFTEFRSDSNGNLSPLEMKVIDVGWGFERLLWYYSGAASIYDATFWPEMEYMRQKSQLELPQQLFDNYSRLAAKLDVETVHNLRDEKLKIAKELNISLDSLEKTIAPMQALYAIADHSRSLLFAISDGALPSNNAGGYNLRVLARRAFSFLDQYPFDFSLFDIMELHSKDLKGLYPQLSENLGEVQEIIEEEKKKYLSSKVSATKSAQSIISKGKPLQTKDLLQLYESHGVTPETLEMAAVQLNSSIQIPSEYYRLLTEKHIMEKHQAKTSPMSLESLPVTVPIYYQQPYLQECTAKVIKIDSNKVVLDQTIFYPEGGGQIYDTGTISGIKVNKVEKISGVIIHYVENARSLTEGSTVKLSIDWQRRHSVMRHHSATHVMIQTSRRILGNHVWQCGSNKEEFDAHVDITHFKKLSKEQIQAIEDAANQLIWQARPIIMQEMPRGEAEKKFGFRLYQGGGAIGKLLRIVEIGGYDVQACGGVHVQNTSEIGVIRIIGVENIQDGVVRLRYQAGPMALKGLHAQDLLIEQTVNGLSTTLSALPSTTQRLFADWKEANKEADKLTEMLTDSMSENFIESNKNENKIINCGKISQNDKFIEKLVLSIASNEGYCAVASNDLGFVACACNEKSENSANGLLEKTGAKGGGNKKFARGKLD